MPQTPLCSAITRRTDSRSVQEAQTPFFLKPETVSESTLTPSTVRPDRPRTQTPLPVFAQASTERGFFPMRPDHGPVAVAAQGEVRLGDQDGLPVRAGHDDDGVTRPSGVHRLLDRLAGPHHMGGRG